MLVTRQRAPRKNKAVGRGLHFADFATVTSDVRGSVPAIAVIALSGQPTDVHGGALLADDTSATCMILLRAFKLTLHYRKRDIRIEVVTKIMSQVFIFAPHARLAFFVCLFVLQTL